VQGANVLGAKLEIKEWAQGILLQKMFYKAEMSTKSPKMVILGSAYGTNCFVK
jgi:hypothetical protein